jgi:hypothetical protein
MDEEYTYIGYRIIDYIGYDEYESDREIIVGETNNLLFCIRNLHEQCKNDITEMNLCIESSYDISYYICVYKELFCGVTLNILIGVKFNYHLEIFIPFHTIKKIMINKKRKYIPLYNPLL